MDATVGVLRGDKGVRKEESLSTMGYFRRALGLARQQWQLFACALLMLAFNNGTRLFTPHIQVVCVCVCVCVCLFGCVCMYVSVYLSFCLSVYLSVCRSVGLSVCLSVCLSVYLFICLSVCLSVPVCVYLCV